MSEITTSNFFRKMLKLIILCRTWSKSDYFVNSSAWLWAQYEVLRVGIPLNLTGKFTVFYSDSWILMCIRIIYCDLHMVVLHRWCRSWKCFHPCCIPCWTPMCRRWHSCSVEPRRGLKTFYLWEQKIPASMNTQNGISIYKSVTMQGTGRKYSLPLDCAKDITCV